ncbi:agmatine/peptidylarginine deiminase [Pleionea sp. CnH1-48]|uniref:agmatine deiminase family protein n=1 Tax=Pleionea sp. CnH1-48 TaxID=2954494 RepID=UPI00209863FD|nr:agmatine deiminase family protein [Pleionea sp. CnH1-48]MCO7222898.1 agmatine deiminase family protein [Pleionea sp. CnH1-48]
MKTVSMTMPAEWQQHECCWMAWPCRQDLWQNISAARDAFAQVAKAISAFEPVIMVCHQSDKVDCERQVGQFAQVLVWPIDDSWTRDSGPTFVRTQDGSLSVVNWQFNGWGGQFTPYDQDAEFARRVAQHLELSVIESSLTTEGGAIHVNGAGLALTTEQCLLNSNRNSGWSKEQIEGEFSRCLGVDKTIWLERGLTDDHTDGHIDELACFVSERELVALYCDDSSDSNYSILQNNYQRLIQATDVNEQPLKVQKIHQPEARFLSDQSRMSLSYINFYLPNKGLIMAEFNQPDYDRAAKETLQQCFPEREIIQLPALDIFQGGGGIHCITQQQPIAKVV